MDARQVSAVLSFFGFPVYRRVARALGIPINMFSWGNIFKPTEISTATIGGVFTNVALHEERDIGKFKAGGNVVLVGSLYGESFQEGYNPVPADGEQKKRGRRPRKRERKRKPKGNNRYFNSQITFVVKDRKNAKKLYKIKVYRNGVFQIPGILMNDYSDMQEPLETVRTALSSALERKDIEISSTNIQMYNCKSILVDPEISIIARKFGSLVQESVKYDNPLRLFSCAFMSDKNAAKVTIKFLRPSAKKKNKKITLKVLQQKINFEGCASETQVGEIFDWLNDFVIEHYATCIHDPLWADDARDVSGSASSSYLPAAEPATAVDDPPAAAADEPDIMDGFV